METIDKLDRTASKLRIGSTSVLAGIEICQSILYCNVKKSTIIMLHDSFQKAAEEIIQVTEM